MSSTRSESRSSFSFLRTTPARNPRTECGCQPVALTMASIVQPSVDRSRASTRACLESARAPDAFVGKAGESATGKTFDATGLFLLVPTCLALTDRVAANFEAASLVTGCFALAFVIRISVVVGHPSRLTTAAPQW